MTNTRNAAVRAVRTFFQAWLGAFGVLAVPFMYDVIKSIGEAEGIIRLDLTPLANAGIAGVFAGVIALITFLQNLLEDNTSVNVPK